MATMGEDEVEYDSDPEEGNKLLALRRREASDDDGSDEDGQDDTPRMNKRGVVHSDESDGEGGAAEYVNEQEESEEEVYEDDEEEEDDYVEDGQGVAGTEGSTVAAVKKSESGGKKVEDGDEHVEGEEQKVAEPFAVPTAGAFYMHDDRFRDTAGGRHRRTLGGKKLWESKDDLKWGHDKFEEMKVHERHYEQRTSRGRHQGRAKSRGADRGSARGNRSQAFIENNSQNQVSKIGRRRGLRRYEPVVKNNSQLPPAENSFRAVKREESSKIDQGTARATNVEHARDLANKHSFASSLSSASPPFYPSVYSSTLPQKKEAHAGAMNRNLAYVPKGHTALGGIGDSIGLDKLNVNDITSANNGASLKMPSSGSQIVNAVHSTQYRAPGGRIVPGQVRYQPAPTHNQVNRFSPPRQIHDVQKGPVQRWIQPSARASVQQLGQRPVSDSHASPPKTAMSITSYDIGEVEYVSETGKLKDSMVEKGKGTLQGNGRGSFLYSGAPVMGATGNGTVSNADKNFPAFLPVMQFGHQRPGGVGVPAVGMAFPGYVAQPQPGLGNSEMTWLPVLAGAAGALGAQYCSPYMAMDGSYHAQASGQPSSAGSSGKEDVANKSDDDSNTSDRPEPTNDRQSNPNKQPRRYSEMTFSK